MQIEPESSRTLIMVIMFLLNLIGVLGLRVCAISRTWR
jgi:hypothetical protein